MIGRIIKGVGGFFHVFIDEPNEYCKTTIICNSRGIFRKDNIKPLVGDIVDIEINGENRDETETTGIITNIHARKNFLLRPPVANIDKIFIIVATKMPAPSFYFIDKLTATAVDNDISPVIVINKTDILNGEEIENIYSKTTFKVIKTNININKEDFSEIQSEMSGHVCAFAGASGVGKSSLLSVITGIDTLETGTLSEKTDRGRHTTRTVEFFALDGVGGGYIADTPGFSILDFEKIIYIKKENLILSFPDLSEYANDCKFTKCTHRKEEGCNVIRAMREGKISASRHESYIQLFEETKNQKSWETDKNKKS